MNKLFAFILLFSSLVSLSQENEEIIEELLNRKMRPTIQDYIEAFNGELPKNNPIQGEKLGSLPEKVYEISEILVYLEKISPNYTFFPMGRDSYFVADVAEAFWLSQGVIGKVRRVNGSGDTFYPKYGGKRNIVLADYMEQIGWEYHRGAPSAILFDNTYGGEGTQLGNLSRAMVKRILKKRPNIRESTLKKMIIGLSTAWGEYLYSDFDMKNFETDHKKNQAVHDLIQVSSLRSYMYDTAGEWHASFSKFKRKDGKIIETPGSLHNVFSREYVLWRHYEILRIVSQSKSFAKKLAKVAEEYGVSSDRLFLSSKSLYCGQFVLRKLTI